MDWKEGMRVTSKILASAVGRMQSPFAEWRPLGVGGRLAGETRCLVLSMVCPSTSTEVGRRQEVSEPGDTGMDLGTFLM